ncbi:hypothetical protein J3R74_002550 [Puniceicoccus vermicola]
MMTAFDLGTSQAHWHFASVTRFAGSKRPLPPSLSELRRTG